VNQTGDPVCKKYSFKNPLSKSDDVYAKGNASWSGGPWWVAVLDWDKEIPKGSVINNVTGYVEHRESYNESEVNVEKIEPIIYKHTLGWGWVKSEKPMPVKNDTLVSFIPGDKYVLDRWGWVALHVDISPFEFNFKTKKFERADFKYSVFPKRREGIFRHTIVCHDLYGEDFDSVWGVAFTPSDLSAVAGNQLEMRYRDWPMFERLSSHTRWTLTTIHEIGHNIWGKLDPENYEGHPYGGTAHSKYPYDPLSYYPDVNFYQFHPNMWKEIERDGLGQSFWYEWKRYFGGEWDKLPEILSQSAGIFEIPLSAEAPPIFPGMKIVGAEEAGSAPTFLVLDYGPGRPAKYMIFE
jgi:hypothetical protein